MQIRIQNRFQNLDRHVERVEDDVCPQSCRCWTLYWPSSTLPGSPVTTERTVPQVLVAGPRTEGCLIWWCFVKHLRFGTCYDLPWFYHVFMVSYWLFIMMSRVLTVPRPCFSMFHTDAGHVPSCQGRVFALAAALPMCQISTAGAALEARGKPNDILLLL